LTDLEDQSAEAALVTIRIPIHRKAMVHAASFRLDFSFCSSVKQLRNLSLLIYLGTSIENGGKG